MDIKNIFDFESRIDVLLNNYNFDIMEELNKQGVFLNSDNINDDFETIETHLNELYEKTRVLEEVIDYAKIYVNNEIDTTITECRNLLNEIENMNDSIFNGSKNFTIINVPLINHDNSQYLDRDGTLLKTCEPYNNLISLSGTIKNTVPIKNVSISRKDQAYESNYKELINNKPYRVHYLLDNINNDGVEELIKIDFSAPRNINSIKFKLSNCELVHIIYIYEDNTERKSTDISKGVIPSKTIKGVKLLIRSENYEAKIITVSTDENNYFENIDTPYKDSYEEIIEKDNEYAVNKYKNQMCEFLETLREGE